MVAVTCLQPTLFPAAYLIERFSHVDSVYLMHTAQFDKDHTKLVLGPVSWTPPVCKHPQKATFEEVFFHGNEKTRDKVLKALDSLFPKGRRDYEGLDFVRYLIRQVWAPGESVSSGASLSLSLLCKYLRLKVNLIAMPEKDKAHTATDWLILACKDAKAARYVQGLTGYRSYIELGKFYKARIKPMAQQWQPQDGINPYNSILYYLARHGKKYVRTHIMGAGEVEQVWPSMIETVG